MCRRDEDRGEKGEGKGMNAHVGHHHCAEQMEHQRGATRYERGHM
jgi:hypothetical protein